MRNIRTCYNEHAIRVSDSYCSGPSNASFMSPSSFPSMPVSVSCVYKSKPSSSSSKHFLFTLTWCNNLLGQGMVLNLAEIEFESPVVTAKPGSGNWQLRKRKRSKTFQYFDSKVEVFWDLTSARFSHGPEPEDGFYVLVLADSEVALFLGDMEEDPEVKSVMNNRGSMKDGKFTQLVCRNENFSGSGDVHSSRARFSYTGTDHENMIRCVEEDKEVGAVEKQPSTVGVGGRQEGLPGKEAAVELQGKPENIRGRGSGGHDV